MKTFTPIVHTLLLFFFLQGISLHATENKPVAQQLNSFAQHFATFAKEYPQEKVYLHFDNTAYYLGETIWFKAYVVTAERNGLSPLSKVLYVELVSPEGNIVETKKFKIEDGQCHGNFKFPVLHFAGFYEVRAYTRYMLNFGKENLFSRVFPVYDKPVSEGDYQRVITGRPFSQRVPQTRNSNEQKERLSLSFFPEGGHMVAGLESRVAFKAVGKEGENAPVSGIIVDAKGNKVADFDTGYLGMGVFSFGPGVGKYFARTQYQGKEYSFELPLALPAGYNMTIDNSDAEKMGLLIQKNNSTRGETLGLTVSCRGKVYASDQVDMANDSVIQLTIPKKMLPSGVIQISLFNAAGEVLSERQAFVNHFSQMKITSTQDKPVYNPFERVNMDFRLNDLKGNPIETTFSVAVRDAANNSTNPYSDNALTNLLLSSELKGYIENPGYYFESDDANRRAALDLLMLTQGWSRYVWKQMAGVTPFEVKHPIEKELIVEGSVLSLFSKKKLENVDVSMNLLADSTSQRGKCLTDKEGKFNFALQDYEGQAKLILQTRENGKRKEKSILLDRNFSPDLKSYAYPELHNQEYIKADSDSIIFPEDSLNNAPEQASRANEKNKPMDKKSHLLKEVNVNGKKKDVPPFKLNIEYKMDREMDKIKDMGGWEPAGIYQFLEKLNKYFVFGGPDGPLYKGSKKVLFIRNTSPAISGELTSILSEGLDEQTSTNAIGVEVDANDKHSGDFLNQKNILPEIEEIESVSIIEEPTAILRICPGLLASQKYNPEKIVIALLHCKKTYHHEPLGMRETKLAGYAYVKEFFNPRYDRALLPNEKDYRRTLYWNPDVKTDATGKATISFFNNGSCKAMNVSAETVTEKGVIGAMCK